ncbi:MAG TPA: hypothetical protein VLA25_03015, partial [Methylotenera sp.]|nr:hypothetical protein [Methylotenera sp.]
MNLNDAEVMKRIHDDLIDSYDEEFELELEGSHFERAAEDANKTDTNQADVSEAGIRQTKDARRAYFRELFR